MEFLPEPWVDIDQVAAHIGIARMSVYRAMREDPPLPSIKVGGSRRFRLSDVDRWLEAKSRCTSPTPDQTAAS